MLCYLPGENLRGGFFCSRLCSHRTLYLRWGWDFFWRQPMYFSGISSIFTMPLQRHGSYLTPMFYPIEALPQNLQYIVSHLKPDVLLCFSVSYADTAGVCAGWNEYDVAHYNWNCVGISDAHHRTVGICKDTGQIYFVYLRRRMT